MHFSYGVKEMERQQDAGQHRACQHEGQQVHGDRRLQTLPLTVLEAYVLFSASACRRWVSWRWACAWWGWGWAALTLRHT